MVREFIGRSDDRISSVSDLMISVFVGYRVRDVWQVLQCSLRLCSREKRFGFGTMADWSEVFIRERETKEVRAKSSRRNERRDGGDWPGKDFN